MRPILVLTIIIIVIASAYYDLNTGTIPDQSINESPEPELVASQLEDDIDDSDESDIAEPALAYEEVIVEAGHTVYGIVQALHQDEPFNVQAEQVVNDFEALNPQIEAHRIIVGESYRFPLYSTISDEDHS
ncbi:hypothetical protein LGQ02_07180 [Bacillus shivajii]|uniref:hypothetical protein n=1 Tax=Bacillus shivajii TaxID=1983719 RepID=UPI001CFB266A|nr:hypothetical protein [Bacillus shivajii]UCZ54536.1 hypothetical protein LGQ02_07180 [Bacillus shivajii]